jgi:hypothetical protein
MAPERSVAKVRRRTRETAKRARYLGGIAEGVAHKASHAVPGANRQREPLDDVALAQKVESEAFRHPGVSNAQRKRQYEISREEALPQPASERQRGLERVQQQHWGAPARRAPMRRPAYRALRVSAHTKAAGDGSSTHAHAPLCSPAPATAGNRASPESSPLRSQRTNSEPRRRLPRLLLSSPNEHLGTAPAAPALRGREDERRLLRLSEQEPTSPLIPRSLRTTAESHARARPCVRFAMVSVRAAVRVSDASASSRPTVSLACTEMSVCSTKAAACSQLPQQWHVAQIT